MVSSGHYDHLADVVQAVFVAAQTDDFDGLQELCDPQGENDGDTQMICDLATDSTNREEFVQFFAQGQLNGEVVISQDGNQAEVPFLFGPDGQQEESMERSTATDSGIYSVSDAYSKNS